jgi:hypothetical protein
MFHAKSGIFLICNLASVPDTNVAYSYLQENIKKSCYCCCEDPDLRWKEDFPDANLLTNVYLTLIHSY